jgi:hypothetical protein
MSKQETETGKKFVVSLLSEYANVQEFPTLEDAVTFAEKFGLEAGEPIVIHEEVAVGYPNGSGCRKSAERTSTQQMIIDLHEIGFCEVADRLYELCSALEPSVDVITDLSNAAESTRIEWTELVDRLVG